MEGWDYNSFPHKEWKDCQVHINGHEVAIDKVEYGVNPVTKQLMVSIKFPNGGRLNLWQGKKYAVWTNYKPQHNISTCPKWEKKCKDCWFHIFIWEFHDEIQCSIGFCTFNRVGKFEEIVKVRICIRNNSYIQKRLD